MGRQGSDGVEWIEPVETVPQRPLRARGTCDGSGRRVRLSPVSARRQLLDVSDEVATRVSFIFYSDAQDALVKALDEMSRQMQWSEHPCVRMSGRFDGWRSLGSRRFKGQPVRVPILQCDQGN